MWVRWSHVMVSGDLAGSTSKYHWSYRESFHFSAIHTMKRLCVGLICRSLRGRWILKHISLQELNAVELVRQKYLKKLNRNQPPRRKLPCQQKRSWSYRLKGYKRNLK